MSAEQWFVVSPEWHNSVVRACYRKRGFDAAETEAMVRLCEAAARNGVRTHNALKALHLDEMFGSGVGGCVPEARIEKLPCRFPATRVWNAHRKLGPAVAYEAMGEAVKLAEEFGVGMVSIDNAFHYLWGGAYVLDAAEKGFVGYTNCTALLAEVVPYGGTVPALGTNPHSWAFPTTRAVGFPVLIDWATSAISMGRVQQLAREGRALPENVAIDAAGFATTEPHKVAALLPFGGHKGYGLGLINELYAAAIGAYLPKLRGRPSATGGKNSPCFHFMAIHPEALSSGNYFGGRTAEENMRLVIEDILEGNSGARLPGAKAAEWRKRCEAAGGLLFTKSEVAEFNRRALEGGVPRLTFPLELWAEG